MSPSQNLPGKANSRSEEVAALLAAARAVLDNRAFPEAAGAILGACKAILGADAGLVAVRAADDNGFEISCCDPGNLGLECGAGMPAPLRRLSGRASKGRTVFANDLSSSEVKASPPVSRPVPESALLAPIVIADEVAALFGLVNKPKGFSTSDCRLVEVFAEMVAVAMLRSRTVNGLERNRNDLEREVREGAAHLRQAEEQFRTLVENLPDIVARFDPGLRLLYISPAVQHVTDRPTKDLVGRTTQELGMSPEIVDVWDAALKRVFETGRPEVLELEFPNADGKRHFDCRVVPEPGPGDAIATVLTVGRDVTDSWLAYEAEQRARTTAEALREATVALTRSLDRETVLATLIDRLRGMVPFDRASVMLLEEASRLSVRAIFDGARVVPLAPELRSEFDPAKHPIVHRILTTGTPVLIPDVHAHPDWSLPTDRSAEASWMGVPLFARGEVAGLFSLSKREAGYFNDEHVGLAEAMSSQASVAVENAVLFEQLQASTERMRSLSRRLIDAQESERLRVARDLHDEAGQALASLRYGLRLLEGEIDEGRSATGRVAELVERTDTVIDGLHRLAADLRPASLDHLGFRPAVRQYLRSIGGRSGLKVRFKERGFGDERLPLAVEASLFRVVQEAMNNVLRHSGATRADVLVQRIENRVRVMVEDNGVGFNPDQVRGGDHLGLVGLKERAEAMGGTLTVESAPGAGTTVVVEVSSADSHPDC